MQIKFKCQSADLAQSVERKAFNLVVVGSSPTVGENKIFAFVFSFLLILTLDAFGWMKIGHTPEEQSGQTYGCRQQQSTFGVRNICVCVVWIQQLK